MSWVLVSIGVAALPSVSCQLTRCNIEQSSNHSF